LFNIFQDAVFLSKLNSNDLLNLCFDIAYMLQTLAC